MTPGSQFPGFEDVKCTQYGDGPNRVGLGDGSTELPARS
jgi:hypothetical protein